jgi:hypothetical protein
MYEGQYKEYKWNWEGILDRADIERKRLKEEKMVGEETKEQDNEQ